MDTQKDKTFENLPPLARKHGATYTPPPKEKATGKALAAENGMPPLKERTAGKALAAGGGIWDSTLCKRAQHSEMLKHPDPEIRERWMRSAEIEFARMLQGFGGREGKGALRWIPRFAVPKGKRAAHPRNCTHH